MAFLGLSLIMFMVCASETIFNQVLAPLKKEFKTSIFAQWIEVAFLLTCVMLQPVWVKLAEKFGRPWPLLASIVVFMAFSIMVGAANSMSVMCVARALQGVGGAGMMPLSLVVLTDVLTPTERPVYMGLLGAVVILGKWTGPLIGAALLEHSTWRWAGYLNLPVGAGALAILTVVLYDLPTPPGNTVRKLRDFDYIGVLFWLGGSTMILLGLSFGGSEHPWRSVIIVCLFVFGFITILVFAGIEAKLAKWPIIPLRVLSRPRTLLALIASLFIGVCMYGTIMFTPVYYMFLLKEGPLASAKHIMWLVLGGCLGSIVAGLLVNVRGRVFYREWAVLGTSVMAVGYGLMYLWPADPQATGKHAGYQVFVGLGLGFCMQQVLLASQAGLPVDEISTVTTLIDYARTLGGMIGLVIGQVILKEKMFETIRESFSALAPSNLEGQDVVSLESMAPMLGSLPQSIAQPMYDGVVRALNLVFVADVPFAAIACILCLFLANVPLHVILPAKRLEELPQPLSDLYGKSTTP
ncbi:MFS general substrate transporter [Coemansia reversa NRRL 1564]|uniref:MFS general substrate transporter n=1 Tax=Coemansia reversa (strain ATCC 12441 / NRRL 1564) TaxID=763665 RepID=A0A2G5BB57_COERN|nr:MFS general substrate transporter [Coemansia reversa NRRL 1564]|eukprot:PIA16249.1 MFS general substrate transporter [Coemansia reversa NRRL 1564]